MTSKTEISNLALSHLGISSDIANLDTEKSEEATACRRFYELAKKSTLSDIDWTFATKFETLGLIEENPTSEWRYSYRYPVGCLNFRRILSGLRNDTPESRVPYIILTDDAGKIIYTDEQNAESEYTQDVTDTTLFSEEFVLALSFRLAAYVAPRVTGGDPFKLKKDMLAQYGIEIKNAKKKNMNELQVELPPESEFIRTRS
jgi:hypothetical protein